MQCLNKFNKRLDNIPSNIIQKIAEIEELKGQWISGARLSPQILSRLKKSVLITSTGASTRIEGSRLEDKDVERYMKGIDIKKFKNRDKQEVRGYFELLNNIFNSWRSISLSESAIKHFHKETLKYVEKDERHRGEYKKQENKVAMFDSKGNNLGIIFDTTPPYLTEKEMREIIEWTKNSLKEKTYHPLLIIGNFIIEFLKIHPFVDGNGRLSRILSNFLLLKYGYLYMPYVSHEKLIENNKSDYYIALRKSQKTFNKKKEDIMPWLNFFFDILLEQSRLAIELISEKNIEKLFSPIQQRAWGYLCKVKIASPKEIAEKADIARPTVNQVIEKLLQYHKIERIGMGRSTKYRIIDKTKILT